MALKKQTFYNILKALCSDECRTKKILVCYKMFPFFKAIINVLDRNLASVTKVPRLQDCPTLKFKTKMLPIVVL